MIYAIVFVFGSIIGSFLNVCIARLPKGLSIAWPGSHCFNCKKPIKFYDNIPLVSYIILRAKCRNCKAKISGRYFIVELLTALMAVYLFKIYGFSIDFVGYSIFALLLMIAAFIDIEHMIIPDSISLPGIVLGLVFMTFAHPTSGSFFSLPGLKDSVLGILCGAISLLILDAIGNFIFKKEAVGGGDVKLLAMIGAFLGWQFALLTFFIAPIFGSIIGLYKLQVKKEKIIAYGPFLVISALVNLFFGNHILNYLFPTF